MPDFAYAQGPKFNPYAMPHLYGDMHVADSMSRYYEMREKEAADQARAEAEIEKNKIEEAAKIAYDPATGEVDLRPIMQALWEAGNYREALNLYNALNKDQGDQVRAFPRTSDIVRIDKSGNIKVLRPGQVKPTKPPAYKEETWTNPNTNEFTSFDANSPEAPQLRAIARAKGWYQGRPRAPGGGFGDLPGAKDYGFLQGVPKAQRQEFTLSQKPAPTTTKTESQKTGLPTSKQKQRGAAISEKQSENQKVNVLRGITKW